MKAFRKVLFWTHFGIGLLAGIFIAIMCATGAVLAFEDEILALADGQVSRIEVVEESEWMDLDELLKIAKEHDSEFVPTSIETHQSPDRAWRLIAGRSDFKYIDPYTGEIWDTKTKGLKEFFMLNFRLHRWLAMTGDWRPVGKLANGIANLGFILLGMTGLYLWFPKKLVWRLFKDNLFFNNKARKTTRNLNWHNVFGFWALIPILIMSVTGTVYSFGWARSLADQLLGERPNRQGTRIENAQGTRSRPDFQDRFEIAQNWDADWRTIAIPLTQQGGNRGRSQQGQGGGGHSHDHGHSHGGGGHSHGGNGQTQMAQGGHSHGGGSHGGGGGRRRGGGNSISIKQNHVLFPESPASISIHPRNGAIVAESRVADWTLKQKLRASILGIHTGSVAGIPGKTIAFLGCVAGLVLVYTGFVLAIHRIRKMAKKN